MWFKFPIGVEKICIEKLEFDVKATDENNRHYFWAPDHFSPRIISLPGFEIASKPPENVPIDLTKNSFLQDNTITDLTKMIEALQFQIQNLNSDLGATTAQVQALTTQNNQLDKELQAALSKIATLEDEIEDYELKVPVIASPGKTK